MGEFYILEGHEAVEADAMKWAKSFQIDNRQVAETYIGDILISTVFLGLDHRFGEGPPLLFETMIFGGEHDQHQKRYSTWDQAVEGHKEAVELVKGGAT